MGGVSWLRAIRKLHGAQPEEQSSNPMPALTSVHTKEKSRPLERAKHGPRPGAVQLLGQRLGTHSVEAVPSE